MSQYCNPLMGLLMYNVLTATKQATVRHFASIRIGKGSGQTLQINILSVGNIYTMAHMTLAMWRRGIVISQH